MAGSLSVATSDIGSSITKYAVTWTSDASGDVNGTTFDVKHGTIISVEFVPGTGGSQPTNLYDVDALDEHDVSVFDNGAGTTIGANLSNTIATHALPLLGVTGTTPHRRWHQGGPIELTVAAAGNTKSGLVAIYVVDGVV